MLIVNNVYALIICAFSPIRSLMSQFRLSQSLLVGPQMTIEVHCRVACVSIVLPNNLSMRWEWTTNFVGSFRFSPISPLPTWSIHLANATSSGLVRMFFLQMSYFEGRPYL